MTKISIYGQAIGLLAIALAHSSSQQSLFTAVLGGPTVTVIDRHLREGPGWTGFAMEGSDRDPRRPAMALGSGAPGSIGGWSARLPDAPHGTDGSCRFNRLAFGFSPQFEYGLGRRIMGGRADWLGLVHVGYQLFNERGMVEFPGHAVPA